MRLMFAPDRNTLFSRFFDGTTQVWDIATGRQLANLTETRLSDSKTPPDVLRGRPLARTTRRRLGGRWLLAAPAETGTIWVYDVATWTSFTLDGSSPPRFPWRSRLLHGGKHPWRFPEKVRSFRWGSDFPVDGAGPSAAAASGGCTAAAFGGSSAARRGNQFKGPTAVKVADLGPVVLAAFAPDGKAVAVVRKYGEATKPIDVRGDRRRASRCSSSWTFRRPGDAANVAGRGCDSLALVLGRRPKTCHHGGDAAATIWDVATGTKIKSLEAAIPDVDAVSPLAITPDGPAVVTAGPGPETRVWGVASERDREHGRS